MTYRLFDPGTRHIHSSRDVIFDKSRGWRWNLGTNVNASVAQQDFSVKF
jgi:hypothetical protein